MSAGASLGAMVAITFGALLPVGGVATASLAGALLAVLVVYALARARQHGLSTTVLLLSGVTLNAFFSALILLVQYLSNFAQTYRAMRWLMGDLDVASYTPLLAALPFVLLAFVAFAWLARPLNLLSLGAQAAGSARPRRHLRAARGLPQRVDGNRSRRLRRRPDRLRGHHRAPPRSACIIGADHRLVLPASALFGARLSRRVRHGGADGAGAAGARTAGRHHHGPRRRPVLLVAAC